MVAQQAKTTEIQGTVEKVGAYGFILAGREGWVSLSKFATPRPELPRERDHVTVTLDASGYARAITVSSPIAPAAAFAQAPEQATQPAEAGLPSRDRQIARMNALGHAIAILAAAGQVVDAGMAIEMAEQIEAWILR